MIIHNKNTTRVFLITLGILSIIVTSCTKLIEVDAPGTSISAKNVFENDETATAVLTAMYAQMSRSNVQNFEMTGISVYAGLSADEYSLFNPEGTPGLTAFYNNDLGSNTTGGEYWTFLYNNIYKCNTAIEGLSTSNSLTVNVKTRLLGEAIFMRAFYYFYLTNFYGQVPLIITSDYKFNSNIGRAELSVIRNQIIEDLINASNLLTKDYVSGDATTVTDEKVRPNKYAAKALLARTYLFDEQFLKAEQTVDEILGSDMYDTVELGKVFLANSKEAIWQLQPVNQGWNSEEGRFFVLPPIGPNDYEHPLFLSTSLVGDFESDDKRREIWINQFVGQNSNIIYNYPAKYKSAKLGEPVTEYSTLLRIAEQYLIRAESRLKIGKIAEGLSDINIIRKRAGLPNLSMINELSIDDVILHERRNELFSEWGHRWFDLKRTNKANSVLASIKGAYWSENDQLYPIPQHDILTNPSLRDRQNAGY